MAVTADKLKPEFEIGDIFEEKIVVSQHSLFVYIAADSFCYAILHQESNKFEGFKFYDFSFSKSINETLNLVGKIIGEEKLLQHNGYKKKWVAVESKKNLLIPASEYKMADGARVFNLHHEFAAHEDLFCDRVSQLHAMNMYAMDSSLTYFVKHNFVGAHVYHYTTAWLNSILLKYKSRNETFLFANVLNRNVNIAVMAQGALQYYNTFSFFSDDDIMYYMMNVTEQLKLDTYQLKTEISQHCSRNIDLRNMLSKYLRDIKFVDRTANHLFNYHFNSVPSHFFATVFDLDLCE